ncbi:MAG: protein translocase subunit SecF [Gammaproteobacteria bacterium]|nr:protein translocase subunit SecF [Gammaproteobacteria bacterium]
MQLLSKPTKFDFVGQRRKAVWFSVGLLLLSLLSLGFRGLDLGIDFTGGTLVEVGYPGPADVEKAREALAEAGFPEAIVQHFGTNSEVLVRIAPRDELNKAELSTTLEDALEAAHGEQLEMRRVEFVGPQIGEELREDGGIAMLIALAGILIYIALRFEWRFAIGSVAALAHDVVITLGFFSVIGIEFDLTVLAAVLAVIGYSLNDTIVVFDRVRENFRKLRRATVEQTANISLNQTLSRTLMTSLTTLLVLLALFFLGGELIHGFATALIVGVFIGTYSSIYVATSSVLALGARREDLLPMAKEGAEA